MYKKSTKRAYRQHVVAKYDTQGDRPWFGEMALLNNAPRQATAICSETTKVLIVNAADFHLFLEICPTFASMFATSATSYSALNTMMQIQEQDNIISQLDLAGAFASDLIEATTRMPRASTSKLQSLIRSETRAAAHWGRLVSSILALYYQHKRLAVARKEANLRMSRTSLNPQSSPNSIRRISPIRE